MFYRIFLVACVYFYGFSSFILNGEADLANTLDAGDVVGIS